MRFSNLLQNKKVIFFDVMGTLVDPKATFIESVKETYDDFTGRLADAPSSEQFIHLLLQAMKRIRRQQKNRKNQHKGQINVSRIRWYSLQSALKSSKLPFDQNTREQFMNIVSERQPQHPVLYPDVLPFFQRFSDSHTFAIITNNDRIHLDQMHLENWIQEQHIFTAKKAGARKPSPEIFRYALRNIHCSPKQAVVIGDSKKNDIAGATRAGIDAIWIKRGRNKKKRTTKTEGKPIATIRTLEELLRS